MFDWNRSLDTGIAVIDEQHRHLVGILARLFEAMQEGSGQRVLGEIIDQLQVYALEHFRLEEELMQRQGFPDLEAHRGEHALFQRKVADLQRQQQGGEADGVLSVQAVLFLRNWLTEHIGRVDQALGDYLRRQGGD